ncbi:MAG: hypothetical protein KJN93_01510 [Alphaproteobacteria bacterium]|nr:hypothetical protein [Alphaproteobacteria bacterium]
MPDPKLLAVITALCLFGGQGHAQARYTVEQLLEIEQLIVSKDCTALRGYLAVNPEVMVGSDPLAIELRKFSQSVDTGLIECLAAPDAVAAQQALGIDSLAAAY